jgi:tripartite-type tricarboxylate transporter receptor subunit TctC
MLEKAMLVKCALLSAVVGVGLGALSLESASAQAYPTRPITMILPFPPGSTSDIVVHFLADRLSVSLGRPVIVDHRPGGAGGTIAPKAVASAEPDGHALLLSTPGPLVVAPAIYRNLGYEPAKAFAPVATLLSSPQLLVVNPALPVTSLQALVTYAKANPGKINYASPGYGTQPHLLGEMLRLMARIDIAHVPYKGPAQIITDLIAGQVQMDFETVALLLPHVDAGKLRALAVADESRSSQLPDVPTTVESGFPKLQATFWSGVLAPAGTPTHIVNKLNAAINDAMSSKDLESALAKLSARPKLGTPQDFAAFMAAETRKWSEVVAAAGIKAE